MNRLFAIAYDWLLYRLGFTGDFSRLTFEANNVSLLAVGLQNTSPCTAHAGIAYRTTAGVLRFLHFANHEMLRDQMCSGKYVYAVPPLKEEDQEFVAAFCERVSRANQHGKLPYAFEFDPNLVFNPNTGLIVLNSQRGFTCSTFVVALFRSAGNPLVDPTTWPRRASSSDIVARRYVLEMWRNSGKPGLIARGGEIESTIQTMRISPEQVAGACLQKKIPSGYCCAEENGRQILQRITNGFGPPNS